MDDVRLTPDQSLNPRQWRPARWHAGAFRPRQPFVAWRPTEQEPHPVQPRAAAPRRTQPTRTILQGAPL